VALEIVLEHFKALSNEISCYRKVRSAWRCELAYTDSATGVVNSGFGVLKGGTVARCQRSMQASCMMVSYELGGHLPKGEVLKGTLHQP
jgi:hypothetical protein